MTFWDNVKMTIFLFWGLAWILSGFGVFPVCEAIATGNWFLIVIALIFMFGGFYLAFKLEMNSKEESNGRNY
jgi:hypothetical protein